MKSEDMKGQAVSQEAKAVATGDMATGSPMRNIVKFAIPLVLGYILQQMYLIMMPPSWAAGLAWAHWQRWGRLHQ